MTKKYFLPEWTVKVLNDTGWTQAELASAAGLSRTAVNDIVNNKVKGGYKYAIQIAEAAGRPIAEALQAAGLMELTPNDDEYSKEIIHNVKMMDNDNKAEILEYVKMKLRLQKEKNIAKGKNDRRGNRPPSP